MSESDKKAVAIKDCETLEEFLPKFNEHIKEVAYTYRHNPAFRRNEVLAKLGYACGFIDGKKWVLTADAATYLVEWTELA